MKKLLFTYMALLLFLSNNAQEIKNIEINFNSNSFEVSKEDKINIDSNFQSFINLIKNKKKIKITGHTDNVGSLLDNQQLSLKRANEVANYLIEKGISKDNIIVIEKNYSYPLANNNYEEGKAKNRRVEISSNINSDLSIYKFKEKETEFKFESNIGLKISYKSGTTIEVPNDAFMYKNGNTIQGEITLKYVEFRTKLDIVLSGIPMYIDNGDRIDYFNSSGMFKISAFKNGEPIFIKPDKSITANFRLTKNLPDLNLYNLDTISKNWKEIGKVTNSLGNLFRLSLVCGYHEILNDSICYYDKCNALKYIESKGIEYAKSDLLLSEMDNLTDPENFKIIQQDINKNNKIISEKENQINLIKIKQNLNKITYQIIKNKKIDKNNTFSIVELYSNNTVDNSFKNTKFKSNFLTMKEKVFTKNWKTCYVEEENNLYTIKLKDSTEQIIISNVFIETKKRISKRKKQTYFSNLISVLNSNSQNFIINETKKNITEIEIKNLDRKNNTLSLYELGTSDTISNVKIKNQVNCFYEYNRPIMPALEVNMNKSQWLKYFDSNKEAMLSRFLNLKNNSNYIYCDSIFKASQVAYAKQKVVEDKITNSIENVSSIIQPLKITTLGIYNIDQIALLENPIVLNAQFKLKNGTQIQAERLYLLDEKINGFLLYKTPNFAFNPKSKNTLLVFDDKGEGYFFSSKDFKKLDLEDLSIVKTLLVKKIENKKQLENELL